MSLAYTESTCYPIPHSVADSEMSRCCERGSPRRERVRETTQLEKERSIMKNKLTSTVLFCALVMLIPNMLLAFPTPWQTDFGAQYPKAPATLKTCLPCHETSSGGNLDSYGTRLKTISSTIAGKAALVKIEPEDSDGDGYTNLTEIQGGKDPGDAGQVPAKLIFYDNFSTATSKMIPGWDKAAGAWAGQKKALSATSNTKMNIALAKHASLKVYKAGTLETKLMLVASPTVTNPNASVIFSYVDNANYRYVQLTKTEISIGQAGTVGSGTAGIKQSAAVNIKPGTWHKIVVKTSSTGSVQVYLDKVVKPATKPTVSYKFDTTVAGRTGYLSDKSKALFDEFAGST